MKDSDVGWWIIAYMVMMLIGFAAALTFGFPIWIGVLVGAAIPAGVQLFALAVAWSLVWYSGYVIDVITGKRK